MSNTKNTTTIVANTNNTISTKLDLRIIIVKNYVSTYEAVYNQYELFDGINETHRPTHNDNGKPQYGFLSVMVRMRIGISVRRMKVIRILLST